MRLRALWCVPRAGVVCVMERACVCVYDGRACVCVCMMGVRVCWV